MPALPENHLHQDFYQVGQQIAAAIGVVHRELPEQARQALDEAGQLELPLQAWPHPSQRRLLMVTNQFSRPA